MHRYLVENAGPNYSAYSPDLPGCVAIGATPDEAKKNMAEAIEFHLEGMVEDGLSIPEPSSVADYVDVS